MTQSQGAMQEMYPEMGDIYRYRIGERENYFTFHLEDLVGEVQSFKPAIALTIESRETGEGLCRTESGRTHAFAWAWVGPELHLWLDGDLFVFQRSDTRRRGKTLATAIPGEVLSPMPGTVLEVLVSEGDRVERNQIVVVMESMKMELAITAPRRGVVRRLAVHPGQQVDRGMRLLELTPDSVTVE